MRVYYDLEGRRLYLNRGGKEYFSIGFPKEARQIKVSEGEKPYRVMHVTFEEFGVWLDFWGSGNEGRVTAEIDSAFEIDLRMDVDVSRMPYTISYFDFFSFTFEVDWRGPCNMIRLEETSDDYFLTIFDFERLFFQNLGVFFGGGSLYLPEDYQMWAWKNWVKYLIFIGRESAKCPVGSGEIYERLRRLGKID
jgi:hypothetical protein